MCAVGVRARAAASRSAVAACGVANVVVAMAFASESVADAARGAPAGATLASPSEVQAWMDSGAPSGDLVIVDASWHVDGRDRRADYLRERIPTARFYDLDRASSTDSPYLHQLPDDAHITRSFAELGVKSDSTVVVYDNIGMFSAARLWYNLRVCGVDNAYVLDGGLPEWVRSEGALDKEELTEVANEAQAPTIEESFSVPPQHLRALADVASIRDDNIVVDARAWERYTGEAEVPAGMRSGHIPGSFSTPFDRLLDDQNRFLPTAELEGVLRKAGVDVDGLRSGQVTAIGSCGSGVTACIVLLALHHVGVPLANLHLYNPSWSEYGRLSEAEAPLATGPEP